MSRRVFLTGASSGLGQALARLYAGQGAVVGMVARRAAPLAALLREFPQCAAYAADVRDAAALARAAGDFLSRFGAPDLVIANAGVSGGNLTECAEDLETLRTTLDTNLLGLVATFQPFVAPLRAAGRGALVGIASVAGYRGLPGAGAYSASKAAAIAYLESLRVELRGSGVRVVTICPGYVATPMTARNPYPMPFLLSAEAMAARIARALERGKSYAVIPWQMAVVARLLRLLPDSAYDRLLAGAPRKPRGF